MGRRPNFADVNSSTPCASYLQEAPAAPYLAAPDPDVEEAAEQSDEDDNLQAAFQRAAYAADVRLLFEVDFLRSVGRCRLSGCERLSVYLLFVDVGFWHSGFIAFGALLQKCFEI